MRATPTDDPRYNRCLRRALWLTWAGMLAEELARALWAPLALVMALVGAGRLGLLDYLPPAGMTGLAGAVVMAAAGLVLRGGARLRWPRRALVRARLDATLPGRPLAALADRPAIGGDDPAGMALWQAHRARMAAVAATARAPLPDPGLTRRDPLALRLVAVLALVLGLGFGDGAPLAGLWPSAGPGAGAMTAGPAWEGWIRPPAYTGRPVVYLNDLQAPVIEVPQGSRIVLRLYGAAGTLQVQQSVADPAPTAGGDAAATMPEFIVERHGRLEITGPGGHAWDIAALRDLAPVVDVTAPERAADGRLHLPFAARDDYGVTGGQLRIALDLPRVERRHGLQVAPESRPDIALDLPLPFTRDRREIAATLTEDLARHPFANLPVTLEVAVSDGMGQEGRITPLAITLPGRRFFDPLAAAVAEQRRDLLWSLANADRVAQVLRAITHRPEDFIRNQRAFLRLRVVLRQLESGPDATARDELADELWEIALAFEDGDLASALERLQRAQDRLDEAMRNGATPSEIAALVEEYRAALDEYLRQLAQEGERPPEDRLSNLDGMRMAGDQLQELLDQLQQLMAEGRMAEAQELMEMLRQLMENMQVVQDESRSGDGREGGRMRDLADMLREQQGLSDQTFRDMQDGFSRQMGMGDPAPGDDPGAGQTEAEGGLADWQRDLRNRLRALSGVDLPGDGSAAAERGRQALAEAGTAMAEAEQALRDGDLPQALDRQSEALEALRDGRRAFDEAMADERRQAGRSGAGDESGAGADPLGRQSGQSGSIAGRAPLPPDATPQRRAQDLLQELRRRAGERDRPADERDYLRRLLEAF